MKALRLGVLALLALVGACASETPERPETEVQEITDFDWLLERIGSIVARNTPSSHIVIDDDGEVIGSGGCNDFSSEGTLEGQKLILGPLVTTQKVCEPLVMDQEVRFFRVLEETRSYQATQGKLLLLGEEGRILALLGRVIPLEEDEELEVIEVEEEVIKETDSGKVVVEEEVVEEEVIFERIEAEELDFGSVLMDHGR